MPKSQTFLRPSNAGGVSARQGFEYQDHVAASFVILMLTNAELVQVECETADDIVLIWKRGADECAEYVQVKTTESDKKWNIKEITTRTAPNRPTSLIEKSLLCDAHGPTPRFRIVSLRDIARELQALKLDHTQRTDKVLFTELGAKFLKKHKTKSAKNKLDLAYWAQNAVWQFSGSAQDIEAKNQNLLFRLAEHYGQNPSHGATKSIYEDLLAIVKNAASASRIEKEKREGNY